MAKALRIVAVAVASLVLLVVGGVAYAHLAEASALRRYPPPGKLVDIGGRELHLLCKGSGSGPTIVLETGAGDASFRMWPIQNKVAGFARVCVYDRAGLGWSDPAPLGRSLLDRANDLHALLKKANERPPFVFAAHSMGGLIVRLYAREYRDEVAGIVFIDAAEELLNFGPEVAQSWPQEQQFLQLLQRAEWASSVGLLPLVLRFHPELGLPNDVPENAQAVGRRPGAYRTARDDLICLALLVPPPMRERHGFGGPLGAVPIVAIAHGLVPPTAPPGMRAALIAAAERLAALSTNSESVIAEHSHHYVYLDQPELVVNAIRRVHAAARDGGQLAPTELDAEPKADNK